MDILTPYDALCYVRDWTVTGTDGRPRRAPIAPAALASRFQRAAQDQERCATLAHDLGDDTGSWLHTLAAMALRAVCRLPTDWLEIPIILSPSWSPGPDDERSDAAPLREWLESWKAHSDAIVVLLQAAGGSPGSFREDSPIYVRQADQLREDSPDLVLAHED